MAILQEQEAGSFQISCFSLHANIQSSDIRLCGPHPLDEFNGKLLVVCRELTEDQSGFPLSFTQPRNTVDFVFQSLSCLIV